MDVGQAEITALKFMGKALVIDAHAVQPYYPRLLAQACGLRASLAMDGDAVVVTAA